MSFFKKIQPLLEVSDLQLIIGKENNTMTIMVLPKAKNGNTEFPALNIAGDASLFDESLGDMICEKMNKSIPIISNVTTFEKALDELEKKKKEALSKPAASTGNKVSKSKPAATQAPKMDLEEETDDDEETETTTETTEVKQVPPQKQLF